MPSARNSSGRFPATTSELRNKKAFRAAEGLFTQTPAATGGESRQAVSGKAIFWSVLNW